MKVVFRSQFARWTAIPSLGLCILILAGRYLYEDDKFAAIVGIPIAYLLVRSIGIGVEVLPYARKVRIRGFVITRRLSLVDKEGRAIEAFDDDYTGPLFLLGDGWGSVSFRDSRGQRIARVPALGSRFDSSMRNRRGINRSIDFALSFDDAEVPRRARGVPKPE